MKNKLQRDQELLNSGLIDSIKELFQNSKAKIPQKYYILMADYIDCIGQLDYKGGLYLDPVTVAKKLPAVINEINRLKPDIVFFTGDLIDTDSTPNEENKQKLINFLKEIKTTYGKYAVIGNHDYDNHLELVKEIYNLSNFKLLENSYDIIYNTNNDKIFIGGLNTVSFDLADIDKTMQYFNDHDNISYKIILVHEPDYTDTILEKYPDINLILSGHSHAGQVRLPFIGGLIKNSNAIKYSEEYYQINNTKLFVSNGIGVSRYNFRLFNRPSINFYRLYNN